MIWSKLSKNQGLRRGTLTCIRGRTSHQGTMSFMTEKCEKGISSRDISLSLAPGGWGGNYNGSVMKEVQCCCTVPINIVPARSQGMKFAKK